MTELQVKAAQLEEERRHNRETEKLQTAQNQYNKEHFERSDTYTGEHYVRADQAGLISANASAMNAQTNRLNYQLQHDMEYLPKVTEGEYSVDQVDLGYGSGLPLSAQKKIAEIENLTLNQGIVSVPAGTTIYEPGKGVYTVKHTGSDVSRNENVGLQKDILNANVFEKYTSGVGKTLSGTSSVLNSVFGKGGIVNTIRDLNE